MPTDTPSRPWTGPALRQGALLAAVLALVVTLHTNGGVLLASDLAPALRLKLMGQAWWGRFFMCASVLAVVAWRYPRVPAQGPGRVRELFSLLAWTAVVALLTQLIAFGRHLLNVQDWLFALTVGWVWSLSFAALVLLGYDFAQRSRTAADQLHDAELRQLTLDRELDAARLQLLQAQVEPHFLFNALANVRRLLRTEPTQARMLLTDLLRYLEEALPALRDETTTLGREAELVRAFLAVHQVRMGPRLQYQVDVPPELAAHPVPPMALLTLVENALKHGLQPLVDGGSVQVQARRHGAQLVLTVADTGRGMGGGSGGGTGLANLRARLRSLHGAEASLSLALNEPQGVVATVTLPGVFEDGTP